MPHSDPSKISTLPIDPYTRKVSCPRRGCEVPYDDCRSCGYGWLVHLDSEDGGSFVICEVPPSEGDKRAGASMTEARATPVSAIMTRKVISVRPSMTIERLILLLIDEDIGGAPVIDDHGRIQGMVSRDDLVTDDYDWADLRDDFSSYAGVTRGAEELFLPELLRSRCVADLMTSTVVNVQESTSVAHAALAIDANRTQRAVVINAHCEIVGLVSKSDIVRWIAAAALD